jgi:CBS domain containing-hemolysin-like protein
MTEAGHVLKPGEVVQHDGLVFKIERVEKRRVMRVKLEILNAAQDQVANTVNNPA